MEIRRNNMEAPPKAKTSYGLMTYPVHPGAIDFSHPAYAELVDDPIVRDDLVDHEAFPYWHCTHRIQKDVNGVRL